MTPQDLDDLAPELPSSLSAIRLLWSRWPARPNGSAALTNDTTTTSSEPSGTLKVMTGEPNVYLRPPRRTDLQAVHDIHGDPRTQVYNANGPDSWQRSKGRLSSWLNDWHNDGIGYMVVVQRGPFAGGDDVGPRGDKYTERVVGFTGLRLFRLPNDEVPAVSSLMDDPAGTHRHIKDGKECLLNVYYRFSPLVSGQGIAFNAVRLALIYALRRFPDYQAAIMTPVENQPSRVLADKLGFSHLRETLWTGLNLIDYRLYDAERERLFADVNRDVTRSDGRSAIPLLLRQLEESDTESAMQNMQLAFFDQIRPLFTDVPLDEPLPPQQKDEWIRWQRSRIGALIEEEKLRQGARTVTIVRLDRLPADGEEQPSTEVQSHILGMVTYELALPDVAPLDAAYADLSREQAAKKWNEVRQERVIATFPGGRFDAFGRIKKQMTAYRSDAMGEEPHYSLRLFLFRPDVRGQGVGKTVLEWLMFSACGDGAVEGGDDGWYPFVPPVLSNDDGSVQKAGLQQQQQQKLGIQSLSQPGSDIPRLPPASSSSSPPTNSATGVGQAGRKPWYLDATTVAVNFYRRFGYEDTARAREKGPVWFNTAEQDEYLRSKYAGTPGGAEIIERLSMRLHPMVYRP